MRWRGAGVWLFAIAAWAAWAACGRIGFDDTPDGRAASSDAAAAAPASCAGLPATCGPTASESCCASPIIPATTYARSYDLGSDGEFSDASHPATISAFRLDRFEITVGRFRAFVQSGTSTQADPPAPGAGAHPAISASGWDASWNANLLATPADLEAALACNGDATWSATPGATDTLPINCIDWYEAMAFCAWDGGYLPSEAEWNAAAAGGDDQRAFPWSVPASSLEVDCSHANYEPATNAPCAGSGAVSALAVGALSPAGDGRFGQADLAGNVWELVLDELEMPYPLPCDDCAAVTTAASPRVLRGGGAHDNSGSLRGAVRASLAPGDREAHVNQGARCARPL